MSVLSTALLIFSFQFSLLFFHISVARAHQHCGVLAIAFDTQYRTADVAENLGRYTFFVRNVHPKGKTLIFCIDSNGKNGNPISPRAGGAQLIWRGGPLGNVERKRRATTGVWGLCPQWGPGATPLVRGSGGEAPLKLTTCHWYNHKFLHVYATF